nr:hypothetical protein [Staphylococcus sp. HMSC061F10]
MINCFTSISLFKITSSRVDKAQQAQTNPESLNAAPVQDAAAVKLYNTAGASQWVTA